MGIWVYEGLALLLEVFHYVVNLIQQIALPVLGFVVLQVGRVVQEVLVVNVVEVEVVLEQLLEAAQLVQQPLVLPLHRNAFLAHPQALLGLGLLRLLQFLTTEALHFLWVRVD